MEKGVPLLNSTPLLIQTFVWIKQKFFMFEISKDVGGVEKEKEYRGSRGKGSKREEKRRWDIRENEGKKRKVIFLFHFLNLKLTLYLS